MSKYWQEQILALMEPIGLIWTWLLLVTIWLAYRKRWGLAAAVAAPTFALFAFGSTDIPGSLLRSLERPYAGVDVPKLPEADAIVLLGGGARPARFEAGGLHLTLAGDRLMMAVELARLRKAPVMVLGGAKVNFPEGSVRESARVKQWIADHQLTDAELIALPACRDTRDEAVRTAAVAMERGWKKLLLVTSANHMRRASAVFRSAGLDVEPVPCNFLTDLTDAPSPFALQIPRAGRMAKMAIWLHEQLGWIEYKRRGWITAEPALPR